MKARLLTLFALFLALPAAAEDSFYYDVTPDEAALTDDPLFPGAPAIILNREEMTQDVLVPQARQIVRTYDVRIRVKILTEAGRSWADVQIPFYTDYETETEVLKVVARTLQPDGSQAVLVEKPHVKVLAKTDYAAAKAMAFSMPDVRVGSIIDYRYQLKIRSSRFPTCRWSVQSPVTTKRATFSMYPASGPWKFTYAGSIPANVAKPNGVSGGVWMELRDVPAVPDEPFMPPRDSVIWKLDLFYDLDEDGTKSADQFWARRAEEFTAGYERFAKNRRSVRKEAEAAIGGETDPERKLRALYARVQKIRNLDFEPEERWPKKRKINEDAGDVIANGYGTSDDIAALLMALARAADLEADAILVGDRAKAPFDVGVLDRSQLRYTIVQARWGETNAIYLDPGTPTAAFGEVHWKKSATQGLRVAKGGDIMTVPAPVTTTRTRTGEVTVAPDGTASGRITMTMDRQEALGWRLSGYGRDARTRERLVREWLATWLPDGAVTTVDSSVGWDDPEEPFTITFGFDVPGWAQTTASRMLVSLEILQARWTNPLGATERRLPLVFEYPSVWRDKISVRAPESWTVESLPGSAVTSGPLGRYSLSVYPGEPAGTIVMEREFERSQVSIPSKLYVPLRALYVSATADPDMVVLRAPAK